VVSLITDADHSTCTVAVAAAEPRAGFTDVNIVHSPALPFSCPLLLNPAELGGPGNKQQITNGSRCFICHSADLYKIAKEINYLHAPTPRRRGLGAAQ